MGQIVEITTFLVSISAIFLVSGFIVAKTNFPMKVKASHAEGTVRFGFVNGQLTYSTEAAHQMLLNLKISDNFDDIVVFLEKRFPGVIDAAQSDCGICELKSGWEQDVGVLRVTKDNQDIQLELLDATTASDIYQLRRAKHELEMVQHVVENTPFPVWQSAPDGKVLISNAAFRDLGAELGNQLINYAKSKSNHVERAKFDIDENKPPFWFDINKFFVANIFCPICVGCH